MANAYSIIHNYDRPTYTPAFDFIQAALSSKQGAYNANTDKIQNLYDQFAVLDVKKDVDQEYIKSRLDQVKNITNQYQSMDFSDRNFTNSIMSNVSQVLDDKVKEAIYSTKRIQAEDAVWAEKRKKGDGSYAEENEAFAKYKSDRARYLSSEEAGDTYRGGADFIAYKDYRKKITDSIPKIQDALKATWIQTGPSSGYFRSISTMEAVNRSDMEGVIHSLLDEGDKQQMRIDAWASYDRADDNDIKDDYDSFYQERVNTADEKIRSIEMLLAKDPNNEEYKSALDSWKTRRETLAENTFDNAVKSGGRESAYSNLYADRFLDTYLDAYSYEPREIKREIDQVQKANVEFAETLRSHRASESLGREKFDWQKKMDVANLKVKMASAGISDENGGENRSYKDYKDPDGLDQGETALDGAAIINKDKASARRGLEDLVGRKIELGDYKSVYKSLANLENKIANGETIKIKGKSIDLSNPKNVAVVLKFKNQIMNKTSFEKQYKEQVDSRIDNLVDQLQDYVGNNYDLKNLPKFNFQIKNGRIIKRSPSDKNYYAILLYRSKHSKDGLTQEEEANLKMYASMHLAVDPKSTLSKAQNEMIFSNMRERYLKGVPVEDFDKIPINASEARQAFKVATNKSVTFGASQAVKIKSNFLKKELESIYGTKSIFSPDGTEVYVSIQEKGLIEELSSLYRKQASTKDSEERKLIYADITRTKKQLQKTSNSIVLENGSGLDRHYISDLSVYWNSEKGIGKGGEDILSNIKTSFESIDKDVIETNKSALPGQIGFGKGDPMYNNLKSFAQNVGAIDNEHKGSILITPVDMKQDGTYSKVKISGTYSATQKGTKSVKEYNGVTVNVSDMTDQIPGFGLKTLERTPYDISLKAPEEISLGRSSSKYDVNNRDVLWENSDKIISVYGEKAAKILPLYKSGKLDFKLVPSKDGYRINMYAAGNPTPLSSNIYLNESDGSPRTKLYMDDVIKTLQISNEIKSNIVQQYIESK